MPIGKGVWSEFMSDFKHLTFPSIDALRARGTLKWTQYPEDVLPMWVAESDVATCPAVVNSLSQSLEQEFFGYPPRNEVNLGAETSRWYAENTGWTPEPSRIHATADVVRAVILAVQTFTRPGSAIVLPTPAYMPFFEVGEATGRELVYVPTLEKGPDLDAVEKAFADGAGSLIVCNPNNPLGFTYEAETLRALADLADRHNARLISDEIHAPIVLKGRHIPTASVSETADKVTVTAVATSKGWNTAGLKCAQLILNEEDEKAWRAIPHVVTEGVSTLGLIAATSAYRDGGEWLQEFVELLRANSERIAERLPEVLPGAKYTPNEASYLAWIDVRDVEPIKNSLSDGQSAQRWLLNEAKVAVNPGEAFGDGGEGHIRLNFATSPELLEEGLDRIGRAVNR